MAYLFLIVGFAAGAAVTLVLLKRNTVAAGRELEAARLEIEKLRLSETSARTALNEKELRNESEIKLRETAFERERQMTSAAHQREIDQLTAQYEEKLAHSQRLFAAEIEAREQSAASAKAAHERSIRESREQFERTMAEVEKTNAARIALLKEEFKTLSDRIFEEKSGKLKNLNQEQLGAILTPLKEKMTEFKTAVEESKNKGIELNSALTAQLARMMEETGRIGGEARSLVNALKGEQKTQGDWGEVILEDILHRSGLVRGVHYECQETLRDADGNTLRNFENDRKMRPDVIVHYPDGKDVIIDSKVSLTAYVDYCNATDETTRNETLERHIRSVSAHIDELAQKNYTAYLNGDGVTGRETVDFVVMFIPNEGPFHLAMIKQPGLWNDAFRRKVLIVSPTNLMALLKIIQIAWTREEQNRNQQMILDTAAQLLERLYAFYEDFDEIGRGLDKVCGSYDSAVRRLKTGERNRSIVNSGEKLRKLGVKMKKAKTLPKRLNDEIDAETDQPLLAEAETEAEPHAENAVEVELDLENHAPQA